MPVLSHLSGLPRVLNPVLRPLAGKLPPLAVLHHRGRTSGRSYETPVQAYPTASGFLVGLAYDDNPQWARNILAAGEGTMTRSRRDYAIARPRRRGPEARADLPKPVAVMMKTLGVDHFLEFDAVVLNDDPTGAGYGA